MLCKVFMVHFRENYLYHNLHNILMYIIYCFSYTKNNMMIYIKCCYSYIKHYIYIYIHSGNNDSL